jgi:hypothetical protein
LQTLEETERPNSHFVLCASFADGPVTCDIRCCCVNKVIDTGCVARSGARLLFCAWRRLFSLQEGGAAKLPSSACNGFSNALRLAVPTWRALNMLQT